MRCRSQNTADNMASDVPNPFESFPEWSIWMIFTITPMILPIFKRYWGRVIVLKKIVDAVLAVVKVINELIWAVARAVDEKLDNIVENLPEGSWRRKACQMIDVLPEMIMKCSNMVKFFVNKVGVTKKNAEKIIKQFVAGKLRMETKPALAQLGTSSSRFPSLLFLDNQSMALVPLEENTSRRRHFGGFYKAKSTILRESLSRWTSIVKKQMHGVVHGGLTFIEPKFIEDVLEIGEEIEDLGTKEWEDKLVGCFLGENLSSTMVEISVKSKWKLLGDVNIGSDGQFYYFTFSNSDDKNDVLREGSFYIEDKLFVIRSWSKKIESSRGAIKEIPIWVNLYGVPKHLWTAKGLSKLTSSIGTPLFMDKATESKEILNFARVCIEVKADKELPNVIKAKVSGEVVTIHLKFPCKPLVCTLCQVFGHCKTKCDQVRLCKHKRKVSQQLEVVKFDHAKRKEMRTDDDELQVTMTGYEHRTT